MSSQATRSWPRPKFDVIAIWRRLGYALAMFVACCYGAGAGAATKGADPLETARKVDELLRTDLNTPAPVAATAAESKNSAAAATKSASADDAHAHAPRSTHPAPAADDATYLRRVSLDLIGQNPSAEQLTAFSLNSSPRKRAAAVDRLLADKHYGQNWARYWRDVILFRRSDERALLVAPALTVYLTEQFNQDKPWDEIARSFITATGDVRDAGQTAIIMAQQADPSDTTAEISRIFLGIQIQCAQCHNHPTDRWKREQFHELAAFFPRIGIKAENDGDKRSFSVASFNQPRPRRAPGANTGTTLEHFMPDLADPHAKGTLIQPAFFVTGQKPPSGLDDMARRQQLAQWLTSPTDPWFAKAVVNRLWSELVGQGFYEPVDDIGPDRGCSSPKALELLATQFVASGHDLKWLLRTITATEAYARLSRSRGPSGSTPFIANCPQRLRGDQLYNNLVSALGVDEQGARGPRNKDGAKPAGGRYAQQNTPRGKILNTFGYDPSLKRDDVAGTIPQALALMNSPELNRAINGRQTGTALGELLAETKDNEAVTVELYLRCLAREPKPAELKTCLAHVKSAGDRHVAFEDILWALINSTEFLYRQ